MTDLTVTSIHDVLEQYREVAFTENDKGAHCERLIQAFLRTEPQYEAHPPTNAAGAFDVCADPGRAPSG